MASAFEQFLPGDKGVPDDLVGCPVGDMIGRFVDDGTFPSPSVVVRDEAVANNISTMARFCRDNDVELAPHGKTTMSSGLFRRQLDAGAWGITVANAVQGRAAVATGARRVLVANQIVESAGADWLFDAAVDTDTVVFVDSFVGLEVLQAAAGRVDSTGTTKPVQVLIEVGALGGRTGFRQRDEAIEVGRRIADSAGLVLAGVAGYEGVIETGPAMTGFLQTMADVFSRMAEQNLFVPETITGGRPILTAGGSAYFDQVVDVLGVCRNAHPDLEPVVVLRSGCYVTHDHGLYAEVSPTGLQPRLRPALEVRALVQSRPEPTLALLNIGRRDVSHDAGLPIVLPPSPASWKITRLMDQHAFMTVGADDPIEPGHPLTLGISHPCTTFDKWRVLPVVDEANSVVDVLTTQF